MCSKRIFGLTLLPAILALAGPASAYTNQWAAHIAGGPEVARQVAEDHGFRYLDQVASKVEPVCQHTRRLRLLSGLLPVDAKRVYHLWPRAVAPYVHAGVEKNTDGDVYRKQYNVTNGPKPENRLASASRGSPYKGWNLRICNLLASTSSTALGNLFVQAGRRNFVSSSVDRKLLAQIRHLRNHYFSGYKEKDGTFVDGLHDWGNVSFLKFPLTAFARRFSITAAGNSTSHWQASENACQQQIAEECGRNSINSKGACKRVIKEYCARVQQIRKFASYTGNDNKMGSMIKEPVSSSKVSQYRKVGITKRTSNLPPKSIHWSQRLLDCSTRLKANVLKGIFKSPPVDSRNHYEVKEPNCSPLIVPDWYHMEHARVVKRSIEPHVEVHERLVSDRRVRRAEQQRAKSRSKRDLIIKRGPSNLQTILNDERWPQMWYLNRGNGLDMNVQEAWAEGITGNGVVVTILDDGLEKDHPDLHKNYDPQASYDVNNHDEDPMPRYDLLDSNRHGTRCAGEVAATANNSICAVGVAFGAGVGGVRMLDGDVTDAVEARSLSLNPQHIDIYSASWGPDDDGKTVDGPGELATRAFIEGITKGRNGKGSIFVWASGNGGRDHDNCNCDGYTNSIWTLSISSATENGLVPWYSEACSSTLATTYSSGATGEKQVVTTDLHHHCTSSHTGTSASAPLAAGICALALEANRDLTWRDMQHIVVRTAKPANLKALDWVTNGVGRNVSHSFGYGLMDAAAMVRLARRWRTVPEQHKCEVSAPHTGRPIPPKSQLVLELHVKECTGVNFLEHVQAKVSLMASRRGDLQIQLTSPQGTKSTLLAKRPHDVSKTGFTQWPFMSVHTWGERPHGIWKLEIHNEGRYQGRATLHEWALIFYGTATLPDRTEYALYNPASITGSRRPFVKPRQTTFTKNQGSTLSAAKSKQAQHKSDKSGNLSPPYVVNARLQSSQRKGKVRGQHKDGKSANRPTARPIAQNQKGQSGMRGSNLAAGEVRLVTSRPRGRSTPSPVASTPERTTSTKMQSTTASTKQRVVETVTASSIQRGLILLEPPAKPSNNKVPAVFQQYSKIQQLYPLYPMYGGARGAGSQPSTRAKGGLGILQDQQFVDAKGLQLDKDTLEEFKLMLYGTESSLEIDEELDKDKPGPPVNQQQEVQDNKAPDTRHNIVDTEGDPWTGSQQVERVSHPEVQRPTTENQTSGCTSVDSGSGCLECLPGWYHHQGSCLRDCPPGTYGTRDNTHGVCTSCHYTCKLCSGATDGECVSCHADSTLSWNFGKSQCILSEVSWTMQSTLWYYRMTILLSINLAVLVAGLIYLSITYYLRRRRSVVRDFNYTKVSYSSNGHTPRDTDKLHTSEYLSESE